ncbi:MATE family efflux transporter [Actibacterium mucosum]|uniref:MATE family efflux transporter n=1 Tax=Actibacterium mucosum TaxID=1087332 RepID=UPI00054D6FD5|nr:MATE family efflux transporter [Actibacterium mucosum]
MTTPMSHMQHLRALLTLGLPMIGSQVAQFAIVMTDTVMLGWYDLDALGAQVLGGGVFFILFILGAGFAFAVMPMVARAESAGDRPQVRRITRMGMWVSVIYGLVTIPPLFWAEAVLITLGQDPELAAIAQEYTRLMGLSIFPALVALVLRNYLAGLERTQVVLAITLLSVLLNAVVNYALIFGNWGAPELGIRGAALASVAVHVLTLLLTAGYVARALPEHAMFERLWRRDADAMAQVFRLGWPIGLTNLAEVGLFNASQIMLGWLGKLPLAAHGIALNISALAFMFHLGLSGAATVRAGRALGRNDPVGLRHGAQVAICVSLAFTALTIFVFLTFGDVLVGSFIAPDDPQRDAVIALGAVFLAAAAVFQLADACQAMALGLLRGIQDTRVPMVIAAISYWAIGAPVSYLLGFPLGWEGVGVWIGLAVGLGVAAVLLMHRFWTRGVRI